jgi:hypothetical protein
MTIKKRNKERGINGVVQMSSNEYLPSKHETLNSKFITAKKKKIYIYKKDKNGKKSYQKFVTSLLKV